LPILSLCGDRIVEVREQASETWTVAVAEDSTAEVEGTCDSNIIERVVMKIKNNDR
jgi:hypothetical protein